MVIYLAGETEEPEVRLDELTPRQIVAELDKHVVGQKAAKRAVAIALRNRVRRKKLAPDPGIRDRFNLALDQSESRAHALLDKNPKDRDALFAMTLSSGLRADYAALIDKRNLASMRYTKEATKWSEQLLAVDPQCYDGHIAGGISKYIIGSMAAPVRWLVRLGGVSGDKQAGIKELKLVADRGHYLAPFADILLAIAYVRDHDKQHARELLASLEVQFPSNPLFAEEIAKLNSSH